MEIQSILYAEVLVIYCVYVIESEYEPTTSEGKVLPFDRTKKAKAEKGVLLCRGSFKKGKGDEGGNLRIGSFEGLVILIVILWEWRRRMNRRSKCSCKL